MENKRLSLAFLIVSFVGFLDASYLTAKHFLGDSVPCTLIHGCEKVLNSPYSLIFGIPVALLGAIYYLSFFIAMIFYFDLRKKEILKYLSYYSIAGLLASVWFVYVQIFKIGALCEFCLLSALTSTLLFVFGMLHLARNKIVV